MTRQEMTAEFKDRFADEVGDIGTYLDLSEAAEAAGNEEAARILAEIAAEEETHAEALELLVKDMGGECPEETVEKYHAARERLMKRFR